MRVPRVSTFAASALLALASAQASAQFEQPAFEPGWNANVGFVSDYIFRGYSLSGGRPAIQGGLEYQGAGGWYVGAWGSSIDDDAVGDEDVSGVKFDFSLGYRGVLGLETTYDIGVVHYMFPGSDPREAPDGTDSTELYLGLGWRSIRLLYAHDVDWESDYFEFKSSTPFGETRAHRFDADVGYLEPDRGDSYTHWRVGFSTRFRGVDWGLHYVDSDADGRNFDDTVVFSLNYRF